MSFIVLVVFSISFVSFATRFSALGTRPDSALAEHYLSPITITCALRNITRMHDCVSRRENFVFLLLLLAGDIEANPGPVRTSLRIGTLNVRSAHLKAALINDVVTTEQFDCLVITETWFDESSVYMDMIPNGYGIHMANRLGKRGGGIALIYNKQLQVKHEKPDKLGSFEHTAITVLNVKPTIRIAGVYRPPGNQCCQDFSTDITSLLEDYNTSPHPSVIVGDFNIHVNKATDALANSLATCLTAFKLNQHIYQSTHKAGNTLDLVITPRDMQVNSIFVCDLGISYHYLVKADLILRAKTPAIKQCRSFRLLKNINVADFCNDLRQTSMFTDPSNDVNEFAMQIESSLSSTLDKHAPLRASTKPAKTERWQDEHIDELKRTRRYFERRQTKNPTYTRMHKLMCKTANNAITAQHRDYYATKIDVTKGTSMPWKQVHTLLFGPNESIASADCDTRTLSQNLQDFFADKVERLSANINSLLVRQHPHADPHDSPCPRLVNPLAAFQSITEDQLRSVILGSPPKSSQADCIPTCISLKCLDTLVAPLTRLFNLSLSTGTFPDTFK